VDALTVGLAIGRAFLLLRYRVNSAWLVMSGALAGIAAQIIRGGWLQTI
jgi:chromate transporter